MHDSFPQIFQFYLQYLHSNISVYCNLKFIFFLEIAVLALLLF